MNDLMHMHLSKKAIVYKTMQIATVTLLSRLFGIVREFLMVSYLGAGATSDAFIAAFRIPNSLRKIFAEGALSATFIPTLVKTMRDHGQESANRLMTLGFLVFEGIVMLICMVAMWKADAVIHFVAPGFSPQQTAEAIPLLRFLMPFILFISSGALLAGALQSAGKFLIPALAPVALNVVLIIGLATCVLRFSLAGCSIF
jgi:putative peptidoglycan lipid II flippase